LDLLALRLAVVVLGGGIFTVAFAAVLVVRLPSCKRTTVLLCGPRVDRRVARTPLAGFEGRSGGGGRSHRDALQNGRQSGRLRRRIFLVGVVRRFLR
jgi:hypothetical protein